MNLDYNSGCFDEKVIAHEIIHALGFHHEQTREDRDGFITVLEHNIKDCQDWCQNSCATNQQSCQDCKTKCERNPLTNNFKKYSQFTTFNLPYDAQSIMHYGSSFFSRNGRPTITSKVNQTQHLP